jgi:tRNA-dihydrouridine synthase A
VEQQLAAGVPLNHITRHILGLYQGVPGARKFRRHLSENAFRPGAGLTTLVDAHELVQAAAVRAADYRAAAQPADFDQEENAL